jgi:cyclase
MSPELIFPRISRRELLRAGSFFAATGAVAGAFPRTILAMPQAAADDAVEKMKEQMSAIPLQTLKLRDNILMLYGPGGNMVALDGPEGKALVDASFAQVAPKIKGVLDGMGGAPLRLLVNTHWHFDHTDGNAEIHKMGAMILAHENTRKRLSTRQTMEFLKLTFAPAPPEALPVETFTDNMKLFMNGEEISLTHILPAHTDTDIHVHFRTSNVLHMGDTWFNGMYPFFDPSTRGNINGMIAAVGKGISTADNSTKIIPGHGPAGDKAALTKHRDMLVAVRDRVKQQKTAGKKLEEVLAAKPTAEFDADFGKGFLTTDQFVTLVYQTL